MAAAVGRRRRRPPRRGGGRPMGGRDGDGDARDVNDALVLGAGAVVGEEHHLVALDPREPPLPLAEREAAEQPGRL
eukprot:CAMPEP_0185710224 /NCGR_PEP_ID=MMETSP1164-20130828/30250_1 /TAXON_ID=1104430 /ORGANISM="Chrysoreinhardia sp, Strain CCMP2950" /LENGTH=75 /DNA_ID=CAMNT_0028377731 /DNA_START=114 /DNA_END=338 /DNA_ORIENTATION=-